MKREWLYAFLALTDGFFGGFAGGQLGSTAGASIIHAPQPRMAAQEILLIDAKGNTRASLNLSKTGDPSFSLYDHQGKLRTGLEISDDDGVGFKLFDVTGTLRLSMIVNRDEIPALRVFDSQRRPRALLGVDPEGEAALDFYSQEGKILRELP